MINLVLARHRWESTGEEHELPFPLPRDGELAFAVSPYRGSVELLDLPE